jgi:hypothetical protein
VISSYCFLGVTLSPKVTDSMKNVSPSSSSPIVKEVRSRLLKKSAAIVLDDDDMLDEEEPSSARQASLVDIPDDAR